MRKHHKNRQELMDQLSLGLNRIELNKTYHNRFTYLNRYDILYKVSFKENDSAEGYSYSVEALLNDNGTISSQFVAIIDGESKIIELKTRFLNRKQYELVYRFTKKLKRRYL